MGLFGFLKPKNEEDERKQRIDAAARELVSDEEVARWWAEMDEGQQALCMEEVGSYVPAQREMVRRLIIKFFHLDITRVTISKEWSALKKEYQELDKLRIITENMIQINQNRLEEARGKLATLQDTSKEYLETAQTIATLEKEAKKCAEMQSDYAAMPEMKKKLDELYVSSMPLTEEIKELHKTYPDIFEFTGYGERGY